MYFIIFYKIFGNIVKRLHKRYFKRVLILSMCDGSIPLNPRTFEFNTNLRRQALPASPSAAHVRRSYSQARMNVFSYGFTPCMQFFKLATLFKKFHGYLVLLASLISFASMARSGCEHVIIREISIKYRGLGIL